ncbi:MAG: GTPase [Patescibacteria group bacterium]
MIDTAKITVWGGSGGDGLITFGRAKFKPKGPPMGGSGGSGGDVYLIADTNIATLKDFVSAKIFKATNGGAGGPKDKTGRCAEDLFIRVPIGTTVKDKDDKIIYDLDSNKDIVLVAKGGAGGHGNAHFSKLQVPIRPLADKFQKEQHPELMEYTGRKFSREKHIYYAEKGKLGGRAEFKLELKLIANAGLVGLPNAGKSSLLNALTKTTKAPVGSYPFTTLEPNLGVIFTHATTPGVKNSHTHGVVIADIPGIIEGAHEGKGLGDKFLKHIERTQLLVHIISVENLESGAKSITKTNAYKTIRDELYKWNLGLIEKEEVIVVNKIDIAKDINILKKYFRNVIFTSAITGEGVAELKERIIEKIKKQEEKEDIKKKSEVSPTLTFTLQTLPNRKMVFNLPLKKVTPLFMF